MPKDFKKLEQKQNKLKLVFHPGKLESHHAKGFFNADPSIEAVYVIASHPEGSQFHYIHRANKTICVLNMSDGIDNLVEALGCVEQYRGSQSCLLPEVSKAHQQTISAKTGHVHQPNYVLKLINAFKKLQKIHDFDSRDMALYAEAIDAYEKFMYRYCEDSLNALGITLSRDFYKSQLLTCATRHGVTNPNLIAGVAAFLTTFLINSDLDILQKLNDGKSQVNTILSDKDLRCIIQGIYKLEWLLSLPTQKPVWSEYFNDSFHSEKNLLIDFLLRITAESTDLDQEQIKRDLVMRGTGREQVLIAALKSECQGYLDHLNEKLKVHVAEGQSLPSIYKKIAPKSCSKHHATQSLMTILSDETTTASEKIRKFRSEFSTAKETLSQHRDGATLLFLKRTAYILSSIFLGAGLIYSYATKGTCNFFKSKGELVGDKIETYLPRH